jgi:predicted peptidase
MQATRILVDDLIKNHAVDKKRIYVMGLSMGGFGTWDFAARYPEITTAIVPICGGADDTTAERIKAIPTWVFHGSDDTAVWPERSRSIVAKLKDLKAPVKYTEFEKVGHDSWTPTFATTELLPWLFEQKKP